MSEWGGFTNEELRRMKNEASGGDGPKRLRPQGGGGGSVAHKQTSLHATRNPPRQKPRVQSPAQTVDLPQEQRLSMPKVKPQTNRARAQENERNPEKPPEEKPEKQEVKEETKAAGEEHQEKLIQEPVELEETEVAKIGMSNLQKFQEQQKQMEELNKQKRAMLATAIQQRKKKAVAEASKLNALHKELDKLDDLLTEDVSKIRDRIEIASRDYLDAQKRYERAEHEFIEAKMDLHQKEELKESLTEHLYTVIHHNEVRKSKKLAELMGALDIEQAAELAEMVNLPDIPIMLPQASYIKGPKSPVSPQTEQDKATLKVQLDETESKPESKPIQETEKVQEEKTDSEQTQKESDTPKDKVESATSDNSEVKSNGIVSTDFQKGESENNNKESDTLDKTKTDAEAT